jgi:hypothetical protein
MNGYHERRRRDYHAVARIKTEKTDDHGDRNCI